MRSALTVDALRFYERQAGFPQSNIDQTRSEHSTIVFPPSSINLL
jgi:hypothetical protein